MKTIFLLFLTFQASAFTLNPNTGKGFKNSSIKLYIANTDCTGAGFSTERYVSLIKDTVKKYWNSVPTSSLNLDVKGIRTDIDIDGDNHTAALAKVPNNSILAGCNDDADDFSTPGILGSAQMSCSGDNCRAVLILNAHPTSELPNKSDKVVEAVIAHEIGHAFGLGHSEFKHNLMYYNISGKIQNWLGEDDIDGVTYLYPHDPELEILGISALGSCGTTQFIEEYNGDQNSFLTSLFLGMFMMLMLTILYKSIHLKLLALYRQNLE